MPVNFFKETANPGAGRQIVANYWEEDKVVVDLDYY